MKCNCGYAYYFDGSLENVGRDDIDGEDFIRVNVIATIKSDWEADRVVDLYACPACRTVRVSI